jgi:hypothetical protein
MTMTTRYVISAERTHNCCNILRFLGWVLQVDLGGVDITTPLRPDEVFHVQTHHVVSEQRRPGQGDSWRSEAGEGQDSGRHGGSDKRKSKKKSKDKDQEKIRERADKDDRGHGGSKEKESKRDKKHKKHSEGEGKHRSKRDTHQVADEPLLLVDELMISQPAHNSRATAAAAGMDANLLGLDSHYGSGTAHPHDAGFPPRVAPPSTGDRIAALFDAAERDQREHRAATAPTAAPEPQSSSGKTKSDKSKKSSSGHFWMAAHSDSQLDVLYSLGTVDGDARRVQVQWKVVNRSPDGSAVSVRVLLDSPLLSVNPGGGSFVPLASNLAAGADVLSTMLLGLFNPVDEALSLPCRLSISAESLIGPEVRNLTTEVSVSVCASFSPYKLSEEAFAQAVGALGSKAGSASAQVRISCKPKSAFKALGGFLHAYSVETESSMAASMAAKTASGEAVYVLAKASGSTASKIQCDIKCSGSFKQDSERLAQLIATAVSGLSL